MDTTVLDPYLLIEFGDERVCLGIWDGEEVIASVEQAERYELAAD